jgi:hypothetical protein
MDQYLAPVAQAVAEVAVITVVVVLAPQILAAVEEVADILLLLHSILQVGKADLV